MTQTHFDFADLSPKQRHKLRIGSVICPLIARVTTVGRGGGSNAGVFRFFHGLAHDPAVVALGIPD
jgi:hypothetical protein